MGASHNPRDDGQFHIFVALAVVVLAGVLVFLARTPEQPCHDPNRPACAVRYQGDR